MARSRAAFVLITLAVVAVLAAASTGVWYRQYSAFKLERARLGACLEDTHRRVERARGEARDLATIRHDRELLEAKRFILADMVPTSTREREWIQAFDEWARTVGVQMQNYSVATKSHDGFDEAVITFDLRGSEEALRQWRERSRAIDFFERPWPLRRWMDWQPIGSDLAKQEWRLSLYATPEPPIQPGCASLCDRARKGVWLWPYKSELERLSQELDASLKALSTVKEIDAELCKMDAIRPLLEAREILLERIKAYREKTYGTPRPQ